MGIVGGVLAGAFIGIFLRGDERLGSYPSRPRRLVRIGHLSALVLGLTNLLFALSYPMLHLGPESARIASWGLLLALATMPLCCFLAAWRSSLSMLLPVPVVAVVTGVAAIILGSRL